MHKLILGKKFGRVGNLNIGISSPNFILQFTFSLQFTIVHGLDLNVLLKICIYVCVCSHFKKERCALNFLTPKMLQNLPYLWKKKTHVVFFVFHLEQLSFFPYKCPGLCQKVERTPLFFEV